MCRSSRKISNNRQTQPNDDLEEIHGSHGHKAARLDVDLSAERDEIPKCNGVIEIHVNPNCDLPVVDDDSVTESSFFTPVLFRQRWFVLAAYCLLTTSNLSSWYTFSSISNIVQRYYNINLVEVNRLTIAVSIVTIALMLPSYHMLEKTGLGMTMVLASCFNALGWCVRYIGYSIPVYGYWFLLTGSILCAVSTSAFLFLPSKIAAVWFGEKERATATSIAVASDSLGMALSYILPTSIVKNRPTLEEIGSDIGDMLLISVVLAVAIFIVVCLSVKDQPSVAPSYSESQKLHGANEFELADIAIANNVEVSTQNHNNHFYRIEGYKVLFKNRYFHAILNIHGIIDGLESVFLIALNELLIPRFPGYERQIGLMAALGLVLSIPTNFLIGILLDRTRAYKRITITTTGLCSVFTGLFVLFFYRNASFYVLFITYLSIVATYSTYYTTAFEHCAELTYPVSEAQSGVILLWVAQVYSLLFEQSASWILFYIGPKELLFSILALFIITFLISFLVKDKGPRTFLVNV